MTTKTSELWKIELGNDAEFLHSHTYTGSLMGAVLLARRLMTRLSLGDRTMFAYVGLVGCRPMRRLNRVVGVREVAS